MAFVIMPTAESDLYTQRWTYTSPGQPGGAFYGSEIDKIGYSIQIGCSCKASGTLGPGKI